MRCFSDHTPDQIDVIIPTRYRPEKLAVCLDSIPRKADGIPVRVIVIADADPATARDMIYHNRVDQLIYVLDHSGSVFCRNLAAQTAEDMVLYAVDDMEFKPGSIDSAARTLYGRYPDGDGVIGFTMENRVPKKGGSGIYAGVALVGQKFLQRYPNRKLFFPDFWHFAAQEIGNLAAELGRFYADPSAKFTHFSPGKTGQPGDRAHADGRLRKKEDTELRRRRSEAGLIWGRS